VTEVRDESGLRSIVNIEKWFSDVPPSSFGGGLSLKHSWMSLETKINLCMHRPEADRCGIHTSLFVKEFGELVDDIDKTPLSREDYSFALNFCNEMAKGFESENARRDLANSMLSRYFEKTLEVSGVGNCIADCVFVTHCGSDHSNKMAVYIREDKNEMGFGSSSPLEQCIGYYLKYLRRADFARKRSVCPTILMCLVGPNLSTSCAVFAEGPVVDPVTPFLPLLVLPHDRPMMTKVARMLKAVKLCLPKLEAHYNSLDCLPGAGSQLCSPGFVCDQLIFPYVNSFCVSQTSCRVQFAYDQQFGNKLVFLAHVVWSEGMLDVNTKLVVKFSRTYCVAAHKRCFELDQSAPALYSHATLPGGWMMIVMEYIQGNSFNSKAKSAEISQKLSNVVQHLHSHSLVHGDLRSNNIIVVGDRVCLIDFDWSGKEGVDCYPGFMNHVDIEWPEGAEDNRPLRKAHDNFWVAKLI
jgi:RIO1 family